MTKKVSRKNSNFLFLLLGFSLILLLSIQLVFSADVAYIYKNKAMIDKNIINAFSEMNLSVETINEKNLTQNFSKYKFIFAGNERFKNYKKIPVNNYPSVITNYYFGYQWGLTDNDGISKLAATSPLSVVKNGQIIQVYTQAKYNGRPISLPYFYLGNLNKVPEMQKVAGTYSGDSYDLGDVISFARAGTHLINGKDTKGNLCFYGIVESKYWTPEAKQLFKDCVGMVAVTCSNDSQCPADSTGNPYCSNNGAYQDITHFTCKNPGTVQSFCAANVTKNNIAMCNANQTCQNGTCLNINCKQDSDCGANGFIGNPFCTNNNVFSDYITFKCNNPNTTSAYCSSNITTQLKQTCSVLCSNGICTGILVHDVSLIDFTNSFGKIRISFTNGTDILSNPAIISCNQEYKIYIDVKNNGDFPENITYSGSIDGLIFSHNPTTNLQPNDTSLKYKQINISLPAGNYNLTVNALINNDSNPFDNAGLRSVVVICPNCSSDSQCAADYNGSNYCMNNSVYHDLHDFMCMAGNCMENTIPVLVNNCPGTCFNGVCQNITCYNDSQCDDSNLYTYDQCNNPGTTSSYCSHTLVNCVTNNDCGITGFSGNEYCSGNSVFKNFQNSSCLNSGTVFSYCEIFLTPKLINDCGTGSCSNGTCIVNCTTNSCISLNKQCGNWTDGCGGTLNCGTCQSGQSCNTNGQCVNQTIPCYNNSQCGTDGFIGSVFCSYGDVFQNYINFTCNNAGTPNSYCSNSTGSSLNTDCTINQICSGGQCVNQTIPCYNNSQCDDSNLYTYDSCNNPGTTSSYCSHTLVNCVTNNDCGITGFSGNEYCSGNNVFKNYQNSTCISPGTTSSYCESTLNPKLITTCVNSICSNSQCIAQNISCHNDNECSDNNLYTADQCNNAGTSSSFCSHTPLNCVTNNDCGITGFTGIEYCSLNNVFKNYQNSTCINPASINSYCESSLTPKLITTCVNSMCTNGQCIQQNVTCNTNTECNDNNLYTQDQCNNPGTSSSYCSHTALNCVTNNDCGVTGFVGIEYCSSNNVFKNYQNSTCINPGTTSSFCSVNTIPQLTSTCVNSVCTNGQCVAQNITCTSNSQCNDNNLYTIDECNNLGTTSSYCSHTLVNCLINNDCGVTGFVGVEYCSGINVLKNFQNSTCVNPGTTFAYCESTLSQLLLTSCNGICSNGQCINPNVTCFINADCSDNNLYTFDECNNPGSSSSYCSHTLLNCVTNNDCGITGFIGNEYCSNNNVFKNFQNSSCLNGGTVFSYCESSLDPKLIKACGNAICSNAQCNNITCYNNSQCGIDGFVGDPFCLGNSIFKSFVNYICNNPGTATSYCSSNITSQFNNSCPTGQTCSGGTCVCVPKTCNQLSKQCGNWSDSCGGTLSCGTCPSGQSCDSNGQCENDICILSNQTTGPVSYCNVQAYGTTNILGSNGLYIWNGKIKNLLSTTQTVKYQWYVCRCKSIAGSPGSQFCVEYFPSHNWNGIGMVLGNCKQLPIVTETLAPFEEKNLQVSANQFNNQTCGMFQVDLFVTEANGQACGNQLAAGVAQYCVDCQNSSIQCNSDADCFLDEKCVNPGTVNSYCTNTPICVPGTFTFNNNGEIKGFINSLGTYTHIPTDSEPNAGAILYDDATAQKICQLKGYNSVASKTLGHFFSCGDNTIAYWNSGINDFSIIQACQNNNLISKLICQNIC